MGKKRKNFYSDFRDAKRWKGVLSVGMKGFLCTCNMRVKECIREAYNLLNDYAEKLIPVEEEVAEETIEDELERELKDMRKKPSEKMFQVVETGADNTVFIRTTLDDPAKLANEIFTDIFTTKQNKSRFLLRMVPIEVTCKAYMEDMRKAADQMFDVPFKCDPLTFNVFYKARYNSSVLRDEVLTAMVTLVRDRNQSHKVDLTSPQKTVIVEIIKGVCCLSVVTDFYKYRKYNLLEAAKGDKELNPSKYDDDDLSVVKDASEKNIPPECTQDDINVEPPKDDNSDSTKKSEEKDTGPNAKNTEIAPGATKDSPNDVETP